MNNLTFKDRLLNFYRSRPLAVFAVLVVLASVGAVVGMFVLVSIFEHKQEAKNPFFKVVELTDETEDPAIWGKNFPLQYDDYRRTVDMVRTKYGGSDALPHTPTAHDPRTMVAQSKIEEDPRLKIMWAGYAFAIDFREERGHAYMLDDQMFTGRQQKPQPGACLNCHASMFNAYKKAGHGDITKGFEEINHLPYAEARKLVAHPVSCIDCHDSQTMALHVTRPAFMEGMKALKAAAGVKDYDVNRDATRQEMRSYVCGQCHVEYYFKGPEKRLVYPWANGLQVEQILAYYDKEGFKDWTHADTGAPVLKAQHPEFEMWNQGIHARSGVACADCHMPYKREGALKISDHHVRSPVLNINRACQTCHKWPEEELKATRRGYPVASRASHAWSFRDGRAHGSHRRIEDGPHCQRACGAGHRGAGLPAQGAVLCRFRRGGKLVRLPRTGGSAAHLRRIVINFPAARANSRCAPWK